MFLDKNLTLHTKRIVYNACVLSVLLYGSECWTPLRRHIRKLNTFHQRNIRRIMGISNLERWTKRITMAEIRGRWGDREPVSDKVIKRRLQWLGHLARMKNTRLPKKSLFGWLCQPRPQSGPKRRWRDVIRRDLRDINISESEWYDEATSSRAGWRALCGLGLEDRRKQITTASCMPAAREVRCEVCNRTFRRESDLKRHKCSSERRKPVWKQKGAAQCTVCSRWFKSKGGMAVHRCQAAMDPS